MSIISFNKSVKDRNDFLINHSPYQIVPFRYFCPDLEIKNYPNVDFENKILIHSSFTTKPFGNKQLNTDKSLKNLSYYNLLADKLKTKYILIHGPMNVEEYNNFNNGLKHIDNAFNNKIICIEIPAFSKDFHKFKKDIDDFEFIDNYLNNIISFNGNNSFQIVIDTAHLHSDGLNVNQMFQLLDKYKNNYDFIHLNGNIRDKYTSDVHTQLDSINDKIENSNFLWENVVKLNKICICETKNGDYNYYKLIAEQYGYNIVEPNNGYDY